MAARSMRAVGTAAVLLLGLAACSGGDGDNDDASDAWGGAEGTAAADVQTPAMPEIEGPITGPGAMYLDPLEQAFPPSASAEASDYVFEEHVVSGTAAGEPYRVRVQVARPGDGAAEPFSGHAIVEAIHPQGIPFVWNFTRDYLMARGHAAVNVSVFPNTVDTLQDTNPDRYGDLRVSADEGNENGRIAFDHASDIYAQVGFLLKSDRTRSPAWSGCT